MHTLFADHFSIRWGDDLVDCDFRCERSGQCISIRMTKEAIDNAKQSLTKYLSKLGPASGPAPSQVAFPPSLVLTADIIEMARHETTAEFIFHAITWKCALDFARSEADGSNNDSAYFIASIRCRTETQRHWIAAMYSS